MSEGVPGPVALVGSGEYLPAMEETDRALLERVGGPATARVVVLPTAAGLEEPGSPRRWMQLGLDHFTRLGAQVSAAAILSKEDAHDPQWLELLNAADFIYYSGGNPQHLIATMSSSPAWTAILRRHQAGAVLAGCSAGAMAFCGLTASLRAMGDGRDPQWVPALGLLPRLIVMPHFDRVAGFVGQERLDRAVRSAPSGMTLLGIDEDTALVRLDPDPAQPDPRRWQVTGRQTVSVFSGPNAAPVIYRPGDVVLLE